MFNHVYLYFFSGIKVLEDLEESGDLLGLSCCSDFKAIKIFLGIDRGRCKYPCISCYFNGSPNDAEKNDGSFWKNYDDRSIESWAVNIEDMEEGKPGIECMSVIQRPISEFLANRPSERITAPTLHINLGIVNLCVKELNLLSEGDAEIKLFLDDFQRLTQVKHEDYWHGTLNGNACAKVQDKSDFLIEYERDKRVVEIGRVLKTSGEIRKKLYTIGHLNPNDIDQIKILFAKLRLQWTDSTELSNHCGFLKLHYLIKHSLDFVYANGNYTLGVFSEQEFESMHHKFTKILDHYKEKEELRLAGRAKNKNLYKGYRK